MKSLLLACTLSLTLHSALMLVKFDSQGEQPPRPLPQVISIDLQAAAVKAAPEPRQATAGSKPPAMKHGAEAMPAARPARPPKPAPPPPKAREEQPIIAEAMAAAQEFSASPPDPGRQQSAEESQGAAPCQETLTVAALAPPSGTGAQDIEAAPLYRQNPPPDYPPLARRRGLEGAVQLDVLVNSRGGVIEVRLAETSGHDLLDRAAMAAVENWLFAPGKKGEQAVDMWVRVPIRFALHE